jgi:hypothetical protein
VSKTHDSAAFLALVLVAGPKDSATAGNGAACFTLLMLRLLGAIVSEVPLPNLIHIITDVVNNVFTANHAL